MSLVEKLLNEVTSTNRRISVPIWVVRRLLKDEIIHWIPGDDSGRFFWYEDESLLVKRVWDGDDYIDEKSYTCELGNPIVTDVDGYIYAHQGDVPKLRSLINQLKAERRQQSGGVTDQAVAIADEYYKSKGPFTIRELLGEVMKSAEDVKNFETLLKASVKLLSNKLINDRGFKKKQLLGGTQHIFWK